MKGHNSSTIARKIMCNNPNIALVKMNTYIKFGESLSICSQDIEWKQNFGVNQQAITVAKVRKMMCYNPNVGLLNIKKLY